MYCTLVEPSRAQLFIKVCCEFCRQKLPGASLRLWGTHSTVLFDFRRTVAVLVWYCNYTNFLHRNDMASSFRQCGRVVSYLQCITYLVSYFVLHTGLVSSFGGCMAQASYFDTARRPVSFLAKKARFVTTSNS